MINKDGLGLERHFQDIPDDKLTEADQTAFLMDLGWHRGSDWDDLLRSRRVLIISEAGAGKTFECHRRCKSMWDAGEPAFLLELAILALSDVRDMLTHEELQRLDAWRASQSDVATFFLDSIDELALTLGSFEHALKGLARAIDGQLARVRIVITSRPIPIDAHLFRTHLPIPDPVDEGGGEAEFADIAMARAKAGPGEDEPPPAREWRNVALMPLSTAQIQYIARGQGIGDPDALLADVRRRNGEEFIRRPQDLVEICADWRDHRRIRTHREQVASNIEVKLKPRSDRKERSRLSPDRAFDGARKLALAATLSRKLTLRHSAAADRHGPQDEAPLDPARILLDWNADDIATLLERSLFGFASYGRVRFHHRSVIEALAAQQLLAMRAKGTAIRALKRLLFADTAQGAAVVKPTMRPIAAWVALGDDAIFDEVLRREPESLINHADPESLTIGQRKRILRALVDRYGRGGWRMLRVPAVQLRRFGSPELGADVKQLWDEGVENEEVREIFLNLMGFAKLSECSGILGAIAMNPGARRSERVDAVQALVALDDPVLPAICASVADDPVLWPNDLAKSALVRLYPRAMSVGELCRTLSRVTEPAKSVGDLSYNLPRLIENEPIGPDDLDALRRGLTELILDGLSWDEARWPNFAASRQALLPALAAACRRQLREGPFHPDLMRSVMTALRLTENSYKHNNAVEAMRAEVEAAGPRERRWLFEADVDFIGRFKSFDDPLTRYVHITSHAGWDLKPADISWLLDLMGDRSLAPDYRAMILEAAARMGGAKKGWKAHLSSLTGYVEDSPALLGRLADLATPTKYDRSYKRIQRERRRRKQQEARRDAKDFASWVSFWREVANDPETAFSDEKVEHTLYYLWHAMERTGTLSQASGWNRRFIERQFGPGIADRMRSSLMTFWRRDRPTLRSERPPEDRNTYSTIWQLGLAAIAAEAEDPAWAGLLTKEDAQLALRYAPIELSGLPSWIEAFAAVHPDIVDEVLGSELTFELNEPALIHSPMLQDIRHGPSGVARLFLPRLRAWLERRGWIGDDGDENARVFRLRRVLEILTLHGDLAMSTDIAWIAKAELSGEADENMAGTWLPFLLRIDPPEGVASLEELFSRYAPMKEGPPVNWIGALFGDRHSDVQVDLANPSFTPDLLLRLARLAYSHVRESEDNVREGTFTPTARDHAERGRGYIVSSLLGRRGAEAWPFKLALADDPLFSDFRDRALAMALERSAEEADAAIFDEQAVVSLLRDDELPPMTRDEMAALLTDRLDDIADQLLLDDTPLAIWALIKEEKLMRRTIARELRLAQRGAYTVAQENVTADEKETDIRIRSAGSDLEAVIELKLGEKGRSVTDLRRALRKQIVDKYLGPENRRVGCLLVTVSGPRQWQSPETGEMLGLAGLIDNLNVEATRIEQEVGGAVRLFARGLDLNPRLSTEKNSRS